MLLGQAARLRGALRSQACVTPGSARSPVAPTTPRPPARSNGSSRPSRSGCAARTAAAASPVTSPSCKPASTSFCADYNEQRPHQGIGRVTPLSRWQASPASKPASEPLPHPTPRSRRTHGDRQRPRRASTLHELSIGVGAEWAGCDATVILDGTTPRSSATTNSSATSNSTTAAATSRAADAAADPANPAPNTHDLSPMSRDIRVTDAARQNTVSGDRFAA